MTVPESIYPEGLSEEERAQIDSICDRFEQACKRSAAPRIEEHLSLEGLARQVLRRELLHLERAYAGRRGEYRMPTALRVLEGPHRGISLQLREGTFLVGRDPQADLSLPSNLYCSWRHLEIEVTAVSCSVRDLEAKNGTRIDGERIERGVAITLAAGQLIQVGDTRILAE